MKNDRISAEGLPESKMRQEGAAQEVIAMESLRITHFDWNGARYQLKSPLMVQVEQADELWRYHYSPLNLWGYGATQLDALADLHENFDYLWHEFALERDEVLDEKAVVIKRQLQQLVQTVSREPVNAA
jgi:hypothetical protein